jgi:hypothetical protein
VIAGLSATATTGNTLLAEKFFKNMEIRYGVAHELTSHSRLIDAYVNVRYLFLCYNLTF